MDYQRDDPEPDADEVPTEPDRLDRGTRMTAVLGQVWPVPPAGIRGSRLTMEREDAIVGFGPDGV
jgi:hypothetical protein